MADSDSEEWAKKSKQIEAERMKAARATSETKLDKSNLAYLDPKSTKVKGWSNDPNVILASAERMGSRAVVFAVGGVALNIIGTVGGMVSTTFGLGMASIMISGLPSGIGLLCMGIAVLMACVAIGAEVYAKIRHGRKFNTTFWSGFGALALVVVYNALLVFVVKIS